jgi:hypothetical protein
LELLDWMNPTIEELTAAAEQEARKRPEVLRLMTHPGVGPLTALAYVLIIGTPSRFHRGKQIGNYVGMIPSEDSSGGKQRLGHISKQGNSLLRFLLVEAAQAAARNNPDWRRRYIHLAMRRHKSIAKVAIGRSLGVRLYWMWRNESWSKFCLRASRGRQCTGQRQTHKTTPGSERRNVVEKSLTGPTLLEMSGNATWPNFPMFLRGIAGLFLRWLQSAAQVLLV